MGNPHFVRGAFLNVIVSSRYLIFWHSVRDKPRFGKATGYYGLREIKGITGIGLKSGFNRHQNSWKWRALSPHVRETRTRSQHRTGYFAVLSTCIQFSESLYWQLPWPFNQ